MISRARSASLISRARLFGLLGAVLLLAITAGCGSRTPKDTIRDDMERPVDVEPPVQRVATLAPNLTEIVFAAGAGSLLVGVGMPDDYPPEARSLPRYSTYPVDFEAVARLQPDLVLATTQVNSPRDAETLESLGIPTYFFSFQSVEDVLNGILTTGTLLGTPRAAQHAVDSLRDAIEALTVALEPIDERPRVLYLIGAETPFSFGRGSYVHEIIALAGGQSITAELESAAPALTEEWVLTHRPDVIVGSWSDETDADVLLDHHPTWSILPAVRTGRVYGIDPSLIERPGPRIVAGAIALAHHLHPDRFTKHPAP